jgi:hypothetical protein
MSRRSLVLVVSLLAAFLPAVVARSGEVRAPREGSGRSWELVLLDGDLDSLKLGYEAATAWPRLRAAARRKPLAVFQAADVETYLWATQQVKLRPEATRRLLAATGEKDLTNWWISAQAFAVRVDGEFLYGGVFSSPLSQRSLKFPVIYGEIVDGRAVLHLLPMQMSFGADPDLEGSFGDGDSEIDRFRAETTIMDAAARKRLEEEPDPVLTRFRGVLRDERIRALFAREGKLIAALPPRPPLEVLVETNRAVDLALALGDAAGLAKILDDAYRLEEPLGETSSPKLKGDLLGLLSYGWRMERYTVPAVEPRMNASTAVVYTLFSFRGTVNGHSQERGLLSRREYRQAGIPWRLVKERHLTCYRDDVSWRSLETVMDTLPSFEGPCWPPPKDE